MGLVARDEDEWGITFNATGEEIIFDGKFQFPDNLLELFGKFIMLYKNKCYWGKPSAVEQMGIAGQNQTVFNLCLFDQDSVFNLSFVGDIVPQDTKPLCELSQHGVRDKAGR
jgi:hypothetical protein